jgi:hypothetical protein
VKALATLLVLAALPGAGPGPRPAPPTPIAAAEAARYRVSFGALGDLGEINLSLSPPGPNGRVRATGAGRGSLLGIGAFEKHVEAEFDPQAAASRRWTMTRVQGGRRTIDQVQQEVPGRLEMVRQRTGRGDEATVLSRGRSVFDPVGFLLQIRLAPPAAPTVYEVLDGRALWLVTVGAPRAATLGAVTPTRTLRFEGRADPVAWDGTPDRERKARGFTLDVSADAYRTPLRFEAPLGVGRVHVELVGLDRPMPGAISPLARPGRALRALFRGFAAAERGGPTPPPPR